jgi:hypothetical protein
MKKIRHASFVVAICLTSLCAFAHDRGHENDSKSSTTASEMSIIGLAAASVVGAGSYLVFRRRARSRG